MMPNDARLDRVLARWGLSGSRLTRVSSGHINRTYRVEAGGQLLFLQRLAPIFSAEVNEDISAITRELDAAGQLSPRLLPAGDSLSVVDDEGGVWRLLTGIQGETLLRADSAERCRSAGQLLGRFHRALWDCRYQFRHRRLGVHDSERHLQRLRTVLETAHQHRCFAEVEPDGRAILAAAEGLALPAGLPERVVHGDPKISNIVFAADGRALCLVDLDTLARMPLPLELGDALRSWCSPQGEEAEGPVELAFYAAALQGWTSAVGELPEPAERTAIPVAALLIAVELAARFCTDALEESYFGWDPARFESACQHNLTRARSQLYLARSLRQQQAELQRLTRAAWGD